MPEHVTFSDGCCADIAADAYGRWLLAYRAGDPRQPGRVVVTREGDVGLPFYAADVPACPAWPVVYWPWLAYSVEGTAVLANLITQQTSRWPGLWGNCPLALASMWCAFQSTDRQVYLRHHETGNVVVVPALDVRPTGLVSVDDTGNVVRVDDVRTSVPGMLNPRTAGGLTVGEGATDPAHALCRLADGRECRLWAGQDSFTPHVAALGQGRYAVATWGSRSVRVAVLTAEDFARPLPCPLPEPEPIRPPGITVDSYGQTITPSGTWAVCFHDRNGAGMQSVEVRIERQRLTIVARNAAGEDRTGAVRIVTVRD